MNENVIILGVFVAALVIIGSLMFAVNLMGEGQRNSQRRIDRFKERFQRGPGSVEAKYRSILARQKSTGLEARLGELIPRPAELQKRLNRTGKDISLTQYAGACAGAFAITVLIFLGILGTGLPLAIFAGLGLGLGIPHMVTGSMIKKRINKFLTLFPEAIDLIVRGLKSGLPITESIYAVGQEMQDPVGIEFRTIFDKVKMGTTLEDALWNAAKRIDIPDFKFFVISLSVQRETGGNLAETLSNLSDILRKRHQMKLKIKAMSSEGKASAWIIGSLPFIMFGLIYAINPDYIGEFFVNVKAQIALFGGVLWMSLGIFIIAKMINFEI